MDVKQIEYVATNYPSDLTDKEWEIIETFFSIGNKSVWHKRSLVNAVLYLVDNGCKWRALPHDYPPHDTVWSFYRRARDSGIWEKIMDALVRKIRGNAGRKESPSYGIIDSQSAKTVAASEERGYDGGKKQRAGNVTMGNLLAVTVHAANIHDTKAGINPARKAFKKYPTNRKFCGDDGYRKSFEDNVETELGLEVDISACIKPVFEVIPKRWVVERTFGWMGNSRRLSKDYEISIVSEETIVVVSHLHTLLKRLGNL